jgi:prepilin-type N-terminal cleavage/methylation domain-containing protein
MKRAGFTLVELLAGMAVASIIAVAIFTLMSTGMILSAKNLSLNLTSNALRQALDRVEQVVQQGDTLPQLIYVNGTVVANGPAAGVAFDRYVGGPYVVTIPGVTLPATSTNIVLIRSTNAIASPPIPRVGDIIRIDSTASTLRPRVQMVTPGAITAQNRQPITVTLSAPLGTDVPVGVASVKTARLVRSVALLVKPKNGRQELRYYETFDPAANLNDPALYLVVTDHIGLEPESTTPFSITSSSGKPFVTFSLRTRSTIADNRLQTLERDRFNTYARVEALVRPKTIP